MLFDPLAARLEFREVNHAGLIRVDQALDFALQGREVVFEAVFGVRQIEGGLASLLGMFFGLTVLLYGVALLLSPLGPGWLGVFGVLAGAVALSSSIMQAHAGFSDIAQTTIISSTLLVLIWSVCVGVYLLRQRSEPDAA